MLSPGKLAGFVPTKKCAGSARFFTKTSWDFRFERWMTSKPWFGRNVLDFKRNENVCFVGDVGGRRSLGSHAYRL